MLSLYSIAAVCSICLHAEINFILHLLPTLYWLLFSLIYWFTYMLSCLAIVPLYLHCSHSILEFSKSFLPSIATCLLRMKQIMKFLASISTSGLTLLFTNISIYISIYIIYITYYFRHCLLVNDQMPFISCCSKFLH